MSIDVLHCLWVPGQGLAVWGEDATRPVKSRSQATRVARPHPFAVPTDELVAACGGRGAQLALALPSLTSSPGDSPDLVRTRTGRPPASEPTLRVWAVPATILPAGTAWRFLAQTGSGWDYDVGYGDPDYDDEQSQLAAVLMSARMSASVGFFATIARFAVDLAERGRFVPAITPPGAEGRKAFWRPLLQGPDASFVAEAATALPPMCRAIVADVDDLRGLDPAALVLEAVTGLTDAAVRDRLAADEVSLTGALPKISGRAPAAGRAAEAWLAGLTGDPVVEAPAKDLDALAQALVPWDEYGAAGAYPARLVMRLRDPVLIGDETDGGWGIDFALQSAADPSLVVEAAHVWAGTSGLELWFEKPDQTLLAQLALAAKTYEPIGVALRQAAPTGMNLTHQQAYEFLTGAAGELDQAGVVVHLPGWWVRRPRLGLHAHATPSEEGGVSAGMLTADTLYNFSWRMTIEGEPLTDDEMDALVTTKIPLVQVRGAWIAFDPDRVRRGLIAIKESQEKAERYTAGEIIAMAMGRGQLDAEIVSCTADGPLGQLLDGTLADAVAPVDPPPWFTATLRPYQQRGLAWLSFLDRLGLGACLADDMGLGKTVQLLALEALTRDGTGAGGPTLVVCPVSMLGTWQREAARFAPKLRAGLHYGPERLHGPDLAAFAENLDLVVTTYQILIRDVDELSELAWRRIIADEAQFVKNSLTKGSRALARLQGRHKVALTGTPVENKLAELRSILDFCNPGFLGSPEVFRARFANPIERTSDPVAAEMLRTLTRPFILRRVKTDRSVIDDLPDKIETKQTCFLLPEQASLYQAVVDDMMDKIALATGIERRGLILATLMKLKQVCNHPAQFLHDGSAIARRSGKIARLDEITEEILAEGGKALIFTQFTEFGDMLVRHLSARFNQSVAYLHGQVPKKRRDELVAEFQSDSGPSLFVLSLKAGGTGLTLTAANHVIHVDRWWNPAVENQATDRAFRIGQKRGVQVHTFVTAGTLEERIDDMIERKKALADLVVGDGEGWLTELSTADLRDVFALSKEAIGE